MFHGLWPIWSSNNGPERISKNSSGIMLDFCSGCRIIYIVIDDSNEVKETEMSKYGMNGERLERFTCGRCDDVYYIDDQTPDSSSPIINLIAMKISRTVGDVCVSCLTDRESKKVDAYIQKTEPSKYTPERAEELIQAASKMLQESIERQEIKS